MTPECALAWRNYECKVNVTGYERRTQDAFVAGWHAATETAVKATALSLEAAITSVNAAIDFSAPSPSVGHVCEDSPPGRKPGLCWICGKARPHDCVGGAQQPAGCVAQFDATFGQAPTSASRLIEAKGIVQSWLDKQGHERCWYYPELFNRLTAALGLTQRAPSKLPPIEEFKEGCWRYQVEEYQLSPKKPAADRLDGFALLPDAQTTHGPPQKVEMDFAAAELRVLTEAAKRKRDDDALCGCSLPPHTIAQCVVRGAKRLTVAGRKWPIGTPDETAYYYGTADEWHLRLRAARIHCGLTLDALARRLDPPRTRKDISAMEHGRRGLSVELCAQLADALDCDRLWLAGWTLEGAP